MEMVHSRDKTKASGAGVGGWEAEGRGARGGATWAQGGEQITVGKSLWFILSVMEKPWEGFEQRIAMIWLTVSQGLRWKQDSQQSRKASQVSGVSGDGEVGVVQVRSRWVDLAGLADGFPAERKEGGNQGNA